MLGLDEILRRCVLEHDRSMVLVEAHVDVAGGHYVGKTITQKILQGYLWCPTLHSDTLDYCHSCDIFQCTRKPS